MKKILPLFLFFLVSLSFNLIRAQGQSRTQLTAEFDRIISSEFKPEEPGGVVLIAQKNQIIYKKAFGTANLELNVPMKAEMVFNIASMTKQFTAVAVLQLMEQGKLSLHDEITKYLPDYPTNGQKITIENLLTHTAGIPAAADPAAITRLQGERRLVTLPEIIAAFKNRPLDFAPGTKMVYSNNGYMLLGAIIEKVSGTSYPEYLKKNLFKPAGMTETLFGSDYIIIKNRAASYIYHRAEAQFLNALNGKVEMAYSAGAIQSTAEDMFKWHQALLSYKLIKKESLEKARTEYKLPNGKGTNYGYGWFIGNIQGSPIIEHGGNMGGFMSHAIYLPQEDIFVAVFYNFRVPSRLPEFLAGDLAALAIGKPYNIKEITLEENLLKSYVGVYEEEGIERLITLENGKLYYQRVGANKMILKPYAKDKFFFENAAIIAEFKRDASNNITGLALANKRGVSSSLLRKTDKPIPTPK
ncbi:MAG TPA: serine hydrolase domain-containing protein [Pyrinomonadaceae bacterium]|jgi:CubicO group peptidase (beta-lactamase class C family)